MPSDADRERIKIITETVGTLEALVVRPSAPTAVYVFAHGAGAGMDHSFMESVSELLLDRSIATVRFNFPYMSAGRGYPDRPPVLKHAIAAVIGYAAENFSGVHLVAGGKSMGGRILADALAEKQTAPVDGLVFFGYPLHAPGKDSVVRAKLLAETGVPMLFLQGTRDKLARIDLIADVVAALTDAELYTVDDADHSFKVPKRTGKTHSDVLGELADRFENWLERRS